MKKFILGLVSTITLLSVANTVKAEEIIQDDIKKFDFQLGLGLNSFLPFAHAKVGYLLPTEKNNIEIFGEYSFFNAGSTVMPQVAGIGLNYYVMQNNESMFKPFVDASILSAFSFPATVGKQVYPAIYMATFLNLGIGSDLMINKNFGLSGNLNIIPLAFAPQQGIQLGFNIRPEINLKLAF